MKIRLPLIAVIALALGFIAAPALAQTGADISINSAPYIAAKAIYYDANHDGADQPEELLGAYDVYNPQLLLHFRWTSVVGATYYRVSLIQYLPHSVGPDGPARRSRSHTTRRMTPTGHGSSCT